MKKIFIILAVLATVIGIVIAQDWTYIYSMYINNKLQMKTTAPIYFYDTSALIYGSTSGQIDIDATKITAGTGFWAGAPSTANVDPSGYFQYFTDFVGQPFVVTTNAPEGWLAGGDASYVIASAAGTLGGIVSITPATGSNNECWFTLGELNTDTYVEFTASSGKKVWIEYRFTTDAITDAGNILFGLSEEGSAAADFINDAGNDIADKDVVGFVVWEANPDTLQYIYQTSGGAFVDEVAYGPLVAGTYMTAGIYFDGVTTVSFYINGSAIATVATSATAFPDTEELTLIMGCKNGAADKSVYIDWIKMVSDR